MNKQMTIQTNYNMQMELALEGIIENGNFDNSTYQSSNKKSPNLKRSNFNTFTQNSSQLKKEKKNCDSNHSCNCFCHCNNLQCCQNLLNEFRK